MFLVISAAGCGLDLASKHVAFGQLGIPPHNQSFWLWEGVFGFTTSLNEGALFGMGQGQGWLFVALSFVAAVGVLVWLFYFRAARDLVITVALSCVMAGILGNLFDRLGFHGLRWAYENRYHRIGEPVYAVRDWIDFRFIEWPIFNLADSLLVCGAALLFWHAWRNPDDSAGKGESPPPQ